MIAYVYHYYDDVSGTDPLLNNRKPILFSMASLRRFSANAKIYVIDSSVKSHNWEPYQRELDFKVIPSCATPMLVGYPLVNARSMEKLWDLTDNPYIKEDYVVSVSNNLIFLKNPEPLHNGLCDTLIGGDREGHFCFRRSSQKCLWVMRQWQSLCLLFLQPGRFQRDLMAFNRNRQVDETVLLTYFLSQSSLEWWTPVGFGESVQFFMLHYPESTFGLKSVCLNEAFVGFDKIKIIFAFRELYEAVLRSSWLNRFEEKPLFGLNDIPGSLELIREKLNLDQKEFFFRFSEPPIFEPPSRFIQSSGRYF